MFDCYLSLTCYNGCDNKIVIIEFIRTVRRMENASIKTADKLLRTLPRMTLLNRVSIRYDQTSDITFRDVNTNILLCDIMALDKIIALNSL